ncbi:hypothetical protein IJ00_14535 [Calothrix sp. 336/3]|nr:hypothetical protein IJ00_14535 [Calothrix sp. 336/3]
MKIALAKGWFFLCGESFHGKGGDEILCRYLCKLKDLFPGFDTQTNLRQKWRDYFLDLSTLHITFLDDSQQRMGDSEGRCVLPWF